MKRIHFINLKKDLQDIIWPNFNDFADTDAAYNFFLHTLQSKILIYTKLVKQSYTKSMKQPWMTNGILKSCHIKYTSSKKYISVA